MPTLTLIVGPNGAGKTSFASKWLSAIQAPTSVVSLSLVRGRGAG
jgi:predicted ABC-type ATPase